MLLLMACSTFAARFHLFPGRLDCVDKERAMATVNVFASRADEGRVGRQVEGEPYGSASDYIRDLTPKDQARMRAVTLLEEPSRRGSRTVHQRHSMPIPSSFGCGRSVRPVTRRMAPLAPSARLPRERRLRRLARCHWNGRAP